jgi:hypothetical protein
MDNVKKEHAWIVYKSGIIYLGALPEEEIVELKKLPDHLKKQRLERIVKEFPDAYRKSSGVCTEKIKEVDERECNLCAQSKGWTKLTEWHECRAKNLKNMNL